MSFFTYQLKGELLVDREGVWILRLEAELRVEAEGGAVRGQDVRGVEVGGQLRRILVPSYGDVDHHYAAPREGRQLRGLGGDRDIGELVRDNIYAGSDLTLTTTDMERDLIISSGMEEPAFSTNTLDT